MVCDDDLFAREMAGVRPLKVARTADTGGGKTADPGLAVRRAAATAVTDENNFLSDGGVESLGCDDILSYRRAGVQHGVFRKFRRGSYPIDARLDLHRMTVEQARGRLLDFVRAARRCDQRVVLIVHGKGAHSAQGHAVIKGFVAHWLEQIPDVLAFHSAASRDGGNGAVYVLLRGSDVAQR